jgi:hypothetical protein
MTLNPAALNALTTQWAIDRANLDDQQNKTNVNYQNILDKLRRQHTEASGTMQVGLADRGMTHSGPALKSHVNLADEANRAQGLASQEYNMALATLARKRLEADAAMNAQKGLLAAGLTGE